MNMNDIEDEIIKLEHSDTSWQNCEKLSCLYIVREHIGKPIETPLPRETYVVPHETVPRVGGSDFLDICNDIDIVDLLCILDEHMESVKALYPREYNMLISKIISAK